LALKCDTHVPDKLSIRPFTPVRLRYDQPESKVSGLDDELRAQAMAIEGQLDEARLPGKDSARQEQKIDTEAPCAGNLKLLQELGEAQNLVTEACKRFEAEVVTEDSQIIKLKEILKEAEARQAAAVKKASALFKKMMQRETKHRT